MHLHDGLRFPHGAPPFLHIAIILQRDTAPLPYNRFPELPLYVIDWNNSMFLIDDRSVDYETLDAQMKLQAAESPPEDSGPIPFVPANYGCNLWPQVIRCMSIQHTARNGKTYFLRVMAGRRGKPKYHFSTRPDRALAESVPAGFEIYENLHSQVFLRRATPRLIADAELEAVKAALRRHADEWRYRLEGECENFYRVEFSLLFAYQIMGRSS